MIKAGIVGFGYMGHFHLIRSKEVDGIEVIATFDADENKRTEAEQNNLQFCNSLEELLSIDELQLIIICTPNDSHKALSIAALTRGKNVLCEKPAAMNLREVEEIVSIANEKGLIYTVHQNRRWDKDYLCVRRALESHDIGAFTTVNSWTYGQRGVCFGWRADPEKGGGMLYDWGVHLIDQLLYLFPQSKVNRVFARLESVLTPAVDDFFEVKLFFDNGVCANISVGTFALQPTPRWFIFGDRGTLKLDEFSELKGGIARIKGSVSGFDSVYTKTNLGPSRTMAPLARENLETLELTPIEDEKYVFYNNLIDAVNGKCAPIVTREQIIRVMAVIDSLFESNRQRQVLNVNI